jgi:fatty acid desaturase
MEDDIPAEFREMSWSQLEYWALRWVPDTEKAGHARAEIRRRESEERTKIAMRQERTAWAAVAAAGLAAIATVALAVIAWVQTSGGTQ